MKIGLVVPGFSASESDWCIPAVLNLVRELAPHCDLHIFSLRYPARPRDYSVYGATVHAFGGGRAAGIHRAPLLAAALAAIAREARSRPFDLLHALWADEPGFVAVMAGRLLDIPVLVSLMGGELIGLPRIHYGHQLSRAGRWMVRASLHGACRVTVGSNFLRRLAASHVAEERLEVRPLGVDTSLFKPALRKRAPAPRTVLHVASLSPVKNQKLLLRAFALVAAEVEDARLYLVGEGPLRPSLTSLAHALGIAGRVTFHGAISHQDLPHYYHMADLCVLPSLYESQGMVTLEAAATVRATVGTPVGLLPEIVPPGCLATAGASADLASRLASLLEDSQLRERIADDVAAKAHQNYGLGHTVPCLLALYATLHSNRARRSPYRVAEGTRE
jgi:glycosyltransferase involved in cell wall biosynthesis